MKQSDFAISSLGRCTVISPVRNRVFTEDTDQISYFNRKDTLRQIMEEGGDIPAFEKAGPRQHLFHDPAWTRAAVVTCGGLCPGLNDVIKGLVQTLHFTYGVRHIFGIPFGYRGLNPVFGHAPILLDPEVVDTIHEDGGTILGSSRGEQEIGVMVDSLERLNINMLFCVGGDGTLRGAHAVAEEIARRKQNISVVGVPKTIDNDLNFTDRTFGFETAVYHTHAIITAAHQEAKGAFNGIGLVRLMGRDSGFIAAYASLANSVVNFCLVPEVPFEIDGDRGLLHALERRFDSGKTHAVIVAAEGAGQNLFNGGTEKDASGNTVKKDIGLRLRDDITLHFKRIKKEVSVKYFDPSYSIRSVPAQGTDSIFCYELAENAVHAAMAGKTDVIIGHWSDEFTHVPISIAVAERKKIDVDGALWQAVLGATRQCDWWQC
jgi:6-phosphofructokinase 1